MARLPKLTRQAPEVERRIHAALAEERRKPSERDGRLGMSQIGKCERMLWAQLNGVEPDKEIEPRILLLFDLGKAIEEHVVEKLRQADFEVVDLDDDGKQTKLVAFDGKLVGHIDGQIMLGSKPSNRRWALLEIKSANTRKFEQLVELQSYAEWNPEYEAQVHMYMGHTGLSDCLVVVYHKDTSALYSEKIRFDRAKFDALMAKAARVIEAEAPLPRPAEAKSQYCAFCKWCDFNQWCWGPLADVKFDD